jgi:hypothetical protein
MPHLPQHQHQPLTSTCPPCPAADAVLATSRDAFTAARLRNNWNRLKASARVMASFTELLQHLQSWRRLDHSLAAYLAVLLLTQYTRAALGCCSLLLAWYTWRRRKLLLAGRQPTAPPAPDEGEDVPVTGVAELKRKYDSFLAFGLQVQNVLDDAASFLERLQHTLSWADPPASFMFMVACVVVGLLMWLLGPGWVVALAAMWILRPPVLRDPLPPPPKLWFARLPAVPAAAGCSCCLRWRARAGRGPRSSACDEGCSGWREVVWV